MAKNCVRDTGKMWFRQCQTNDRMHCAHTAHPGAVARAHTHTKSDSQMPSELGTTLATSDSSSNRSRQKGRMCPVSENVEFWPTQSSDQQLNLSSWTYRYFSFMNADERPPWVLMRVAFSRLSRLGRRKQYARTKKKETSQSPGHVYCV